MTPHRETIDCQCRKCQAVTSHVPSLSSGARRTLHLAKCAVLVLTMGFVFPNVIVEDEMDASCERCGSHAKVPYR